MPVTNTMVENAFDYTGWNRPTDTEVEGIEAVNQATGFVNDNFADDEILKVVLDSSQYAGQSDLAVWIAAATKESPLSWYIVEIAFYGIEMETLELSDFNMQNVISEFLVKRQQDGKLGVLIASTFGCGFDLVCQRAKVLSMKRADGDRRPRIDSTPKNLKER